MKRYISEKEIRTLDELLNQKIVMFHGKPLHISIVKNWQLGYVLGQLNMGTIKSAIRRDEKNECRRRANDTKKSAQND